MSNSQNKTLRKHYEFDTSKAYSRTSISLYARKRVKAALL